MKCVNKNVVAICLLPFAVCVTVIWASGRGRSQVNDFKVELPAPTGKHAVGRTSFHWIDSSRAEEMTDDPNDRRELMVTLWYPAESAGGGTAPYIDNLDKLAGAIDQVHVNVIRAVRTRAIAGARISSAQRRYPVLVFSPGNEMNVALYAAQIEDLVSHGYIVFGIDHPYESLAVLYPNGRIARYSEEKHPKQDSPNFQEKSTRFYRQRVEWRAADAVFVLNQLEKLNDGKIASQFSRRLDLSRVGAFGHSVGAVAAANFCQSDRRFKACLGLDGKVNSLPFFPASDSPGSEGKGPDQPFMSLEKALPEPTEKQLAEWKSTREQVERARKQARDREAELLKTLNAGGYRVTLRGATHQSFSDEPLVLPSGEKETHLRRTQIIRAYTLAFFDQFLGNRSVNLLKGSSSDYPEVTIERFGPAPHNSVDLTPPGGRLKTVAGDVTTVDDFENSVTRNMQRAGVTGLSVAILNDNQVVYTRQFGWKDKDAGTKLDDTTVFAGASLSKTVFAYLVMVLAEEGIIDLDKPIQQYLAKPLPEYPEYADLAGDDRYRTITARMLLSHTGGFPNLRSMSKDGRLRIQFEPGSRFSYSGEGIGLLQKVVECVTHKDLETIAREKVFTPLGMSNTSYVWREAFAANVAAPHNEFEWAADPDRPAIAHAGGSLTTTAHDYARFLAGILTAKGRRKQSVERMLAPVIRINSRRMFDPVKPADSNANDAIRLAWGHGWGVFETPQGQAFFHTGHSSSAQNYVVVYRKRGVGIVLLSNSANFESVAPEIVAAGIGDRHSPFDWLGYVPFDPAKRKAAPPRRRAIQVAADVIAPYAGKYQIGEGGPVIFIKAEGGRLYASDDGSSWDEVYAESHSVFFAKGRDLAIEFKKGADGKVTHMEIIGGGTTIHARRIE